MKFSLDSKFFTVCEKLVDMVVLSLFWVLCCMPVFTMIPASIALYYTAAKVIRRDTGNILPEFFRAFKTNFKQGFLLNLIYLLLAGVMAGIRYFCDRQGIASNLGGFYYAFYLVFLVVWVCVTFYLLPVLSRFTLTLGSALRLALYFASKNLKTMIPLIITLTGVCAVIYMFPFTILILPGFYAYLMTKSIESTFQNYILKELPHPEEHADQWYMG